MHPIPFEHRGRWRIANDRSLNVERWMRNKLRQCGILSFELMGCLAVGNARMTRKDDLHWTLQHVFVVLHSVRPYLYQYTFYALPFSVSRCLIPHLLQLWKEWLFIDFHFQPVLSFLHFHSTWNTNKPITIEWKNLGKHQKSPSAVQLLGAMIFRKRLSHWIPAELSGFSPSV